MSDYRPAIGPDGQTVIFERTLFNPDKAVALYILNLNDPKPRPFLPSPARQQTRPDWCWSANNIAFNVGNSPQVWTVGGDGANPAEIPNTSGFVYPQWSANGLSLTVMNTNKNSADPNPCSTVIDTDGTISSANINGNDQNGIPVFGGMPAVNPNNSLSIAFAGQPNLPGWNQGADSSGYNQDNNYVFLNSASNGVYTSSPMEAGASIDEFQPAFQGRAPAWSPNGRYIVFESTRTNGEMALYLFDTQNPGSPVQLTDTVYAAQHAKFFPDGAQLIFCAKPTPQTRNRIASIDISPYL